METLIQTYIGGSTFSFTESAHAALKKYISDIKNHFAKSDAANEIIKDIEARIGEILSEKNASLRGGPVTLDMVENIITQIGTASEIGGEADGEKETSKATSETSAKKETTRRRLYRDEGDAIIGGVCSGIAQYFDLDPTIVRVAVILLTLLTGPAVILIYVILWIILPAAKTTADRLEMEGRSATIDNIASKVREEVAYVRDNKEHIKGKLASEASKMSERISIRINGPISNLFGIVIKLIKIAIALALIAIGAGIILVTSIGIGVFLAVKAPILAIPVSGALLVAACAVFLIVTLPATLFILTGSALMLAKSIVRGKPVVALLLLWIAAFAALALSAPTVITRAQDTPAWQSDPDLRELRMEFGDERASDTLHREPIAPPVPLAPDHP